MTLITFFNWSGFRRCPVPGEYILKDDIVDNLNIKDEIAKDLGLKDEITSALDEHKEKVAEESPRIDLSEESESILRKLSEEDGPDAADLPTVSLEEALCLAGLDDPQQVRNASSPARASGEKWPKPTREDDANYLRTVTFPIIARRILSVINRD